MMIYWEEGQTCVNIYNLKVCILCLVFGSVCFVFVIWKCVFGIWSVSCDVGGQRGWGEGLTRH